MGVGVVAGAGDGAEKEPLAFSRGDECHCPSKSGLGFFGLGGCLKSHDAWRTGLGSSPHQARFLRARSAGVLASARARCGAGACFAVGGRFAARQGLGKAAIIGLRGVFDKRHLRAMSAPRARSTSSGRSGSVPWVPSSLRRRLCAHGARRLRRRAGRLT